MPTSFGNADTITANQQSMLTLSERDTTTCQKDDAIGFHSIKNATTTKWKVKWKPATSTMPQTIETQFSPGTLISNSSSILPQVQARRVPEWRENEEHTMNSQLPQRNQFTQGNAFHTYNTFNTGQYGSTNVGYMGNAYRGYCSMKFSTQGPAPWQGGYYPPGFPGGPPPPNMPEFSGHFSAQFAHGPYPQNSADLAPSAHGPVGTLTGTKGRWVDGIPASLKEEALLKRTAPESHEQRHPASTNLQVIQMPKDGSCFFHAAAVEIHHDAKQLRVLAADAATQYADTTFQGLSIRQWIHAETGLTLNEYIAYLKRGGWGGQVDLRLLAQVLYRPFWVYTKSTSNQITLAYTFEPITDPKKLGTWGEPVRLFFDNNHYDAILLRRLANARPLTAIREPPAQVDIRFTKPTAAVEETVKISEAPIMLVQADETSWTQVDKRANSILHTQLIKMTQVPQRGCAPLKQTTLGAANLVGETQGYMTGADGAQNPGSRLNDHRSEIVPTSPPWSRRSRHYLKQRRGNKRSTSKHSVGVKWPRDKELAEERRKTVLGALRESPEQIHERSIVELIGGKGNENRTRRTRTRRILSRFLSDNIIKRVGEDLSKWRVFELGRDFPYDMVDPAAVPVVGRRQGTSSIHSVDINDEVGSAAVLIAANRQGNSSTHSVRINDKVGPATVSVEAHKVHFASEAVMGEDLSDGEHLRSGDALGNAIEEEDSQQFGSYVCHPNKGASHSTLKGGYGWNKHVLSQKRPMAQRWLQFTERDFNSILVKKHLMAWAAFIKAKRKTEEAAEAKGKELSKIIGRVSDIRVLMAGVQEFSTNKRRQQSALRTAGRWERMSLAASLLAWQDNVTDLHRQRNILYKLSIRTNNASMYNALISWDLVAKKRQRQRTGLKRMTLKMRSAGLRNGWSRWAGLWKQKRNMRRCAVRIGSRRRNKPPATAFLTLDETRVIEDPKARTTITSANDQLESLVDWDSCEDRMRTTPDTARDRDTRSGWETEDQSNRDSSAILKIRYKLQEATDQFVKNEWLQVSLAVLIAQQTISEKIFWSRLNDLHFPLAGNGLADKEDSKQSTVRGDCLYTATTLTMESYSYNNNAMVETRAQLLKSKTIEHLERMVQHLHGPALPAEYPDTNLYSFRKATLLGQLLQVLSPTELQEYKESMRSGDPHPAGPLDICVLSHLLGKDIKVYRQVEGLRQQVPVLAKCLDTLSNAEQSFNIFLQEGHFTPLPEVLPLTTDQHILRHHLDIWEVEHPKRRWHSGTLWRKVKALIINTSRDHLQHDHWVMTLSSAASLGYVGLRELMYCSTVNKEWKGAVSQAMGLVVSLTFWPCKQLPLVIPIAIQRCGMGNLRNISLRGCTINSQRNLNMTETTLSICHNCPNLATIDVTDCSASIIIPILSTLAQLAFSDSNSQPPWRNWPSVSLGTIPKRPSREAIRLYQDLTKADRPIPVGDLLTFVRTKNLPQLLVNQDFLPPAQAVSEQAKISAVPVALLLGVLWGDPKTSKGTRVFSTSTDIISDKWPWQRSSLLAAVLLGDAELAEILVLANGSVDQSSTDGTTPLLQAATQERLDIIEMLIDYQADVHTTRHDSMGLLAIGLQTQNIAIMKMAVRHMDHQMFTLEGYVMDEECNEMLLADDPAALTQSLLELCVRPKFLERWILSHESAIAQVYGVLGTLLTIVPLNSTLHKRLRTLRGCILTYTEFYDFDEYVHLKEKEGLHNYMPQLATQEGFRREANKDRIRYSVVEHDFPTIAPRLAHGTCLETMTYVGRNAPRDVGNNKSLEPTTTGLCCSGYFVAWREPTGIVVLDARSGKICRKIGSSNRVPESHFRDQNSVLAFANVDAGDNRLLLSAGNYSNDIQVYDWPVRVQTPEFSEGELVCTLRGHERPVTAIAVSGNNSLLVSGSKDCRIILWNIPFHKLTGSRYHNMDTAAPSRDLWSTSTIQTIPWQVQGILTGHPQEITSVAITFDGNLIISGGVDGSIRLWDTNSLSCIGLISGSNPTGNLEWVSCPQTNRRLPKEILLSKGVTSLAISRNGSWLAGALSESKALTDQDHQVSVWALRGNSPSAHFVALKGHTDRVTAICFHPSEETNLVSASLDMTLRIWDCATRSCLARIHTMCVMLQVAYALDGDAIAGYSKENEMIYTYKTPKLPSCQDRPFHSKTSVKLLHFSPSGNFIASAGTDCIHMWSTSSCDRTQTLLTSAENDKPVSEQGWEPQVMNFSTQEQLLAAGGQGGIVMVWDLHSLGEPTPWQSTEMEITEGQTYKTPLWKGALEDPDSIVESVAFSPTGDKLISGVRNKSWDQLTFRLWDGQRGTPSHTFYLPRNDLPSGTVHLSFPTQNRIVLWIRELTSKTKHFAGFWNVTEKEVQWVRAPEGHSTRIDSPSGVDGIRMHNQFIIVERKAKPIAFYNNNLANVTAVSRRGPNIVLGDQAGVVTFLLLQGDPDVLPLTPNEQPVIRVWIRVPHTRDGIRTETMLLMTTNLTNSVRDLKFAIQTHFGWSPKHIQDWTLCSGCKTMDEQNHLGHYTVQNGSTIEVGVRLRGGMPAKKRVSPQQHSNLSLFEQTAKQVAAAAARKYTPTAEEAGAAMGNIDLEKRSQRLMEEGGRHTLAAQERFRQEEHRLRSAKLLREEIEETLQPMGNMDTEERQAFNRAVNVAFDLIRAHRGGLPGHKAHSYVQWMMAKSMERRETGKTLSDKIIQEGLRQPGNRSLVKLTLRSRMENYTGTETPGRCPTDSEVKTFFNSMSESVSVNTLPSDDSDKFRQGTDFQVILSGARHSLTEQVAHDHSLITTWRFDMSVDLPGTVRLCLVPTNQEHNQAKLCSWISCLRASTHRHGCADTAIEHALLAGLSPSWHQALPQFANNLVGFRLEFHRQMMTKAGRTRIKPPLAYLGVNSYQAPHLFIQIGLDRSQPGSVEDIARGILNKKVTLQLNMVAEKDKSSDNFITFSIAPHRNTPATGQEEAWGRLKDKLRQERQMLDEERQQIIHISVSSAHDKGQFTPEAADDIIRSICQDMTSPIRSHSSQKLGNTVLDALEGKRLNYIHEILEELEPEAYVAVKVSGLPIKTFFSECHDFKKYPAAQKTSSFLQLFRNYLHERGVLTEAVELIYEDKGKSPSEDELLVAFTSSSWRACTSAPAQGEPTLSAIQNSIKKRLKPMDTFPFRISSNMSKSAPALTFTPLTEEAPDGIDEVQIVLKLLQGGDFIFVPKQDEVRSFQRATAWSEIPTKVEWQSLQLKSIPGLRRPEAALGILWDLLDKGVVQLVDTSTKGVNVASMWILTAYLDAVLTLIPGALRDICPSRSRDTNRHIVIDPIIGAIKQGLLLYSARGVWLENNPFDTTTVGSHLADQTKETFPTRDSAALPLAITTMIGVPKQLGQGLSDLTIQALKDLVEAELIEPILKKGHTLLIRQGSDLRTAILQTDKIRVGSHYSSTTMEVPDEDIEAALENTIQRIFPDWGIVLLSVSADAVFPFESNDFEPQLQSEDPLHITNTGSHILAQGSWTISSQTFKRWRQKKGIIQLPLSRPRGILWLYPGFQEPPNGSTFRTLTQLLGPQHGTTQFLSVLGAREDLESSAAVLNVLRDCRQQAILAELRKAVQLRAFFIPGHTIQIVEGKRRAVPTQQTHSSQVRPSWLPQFEMASNGTEILQAALSVSKDDPSGIAAHPLAQYGVLLTKFDQFEKVDLTAALSALPVALQLDPVDLAEIAGGMELEYVLHFEGDRGGGSGGPSHPSP